MKTGPVILTILAAFLCGNVSHALPARKGTIRITQPDGTSFQARQRGDEYAHVLTTVDGCSVILGEDGYYCYAYYDQDGTRHSSGYVVGRDVPGMVRNHSLTIPYRAILSRGAERRSRAGRLIAARRRPVPAATRADGTPVRRCLVIPAEFSDRAFDYGREYIDRMLNEKGYSFDGATGSVSEYYEDQFLGTCKFEFTVSRTVVLAHDEPYYGTDGDDIDLKAYEAIIEACKAVNDEIDFSEFDGDGDGEIDNVFVIVPGKDQADNGEEGLIWSHQWYVLDGAGQNVVLDGKLLNGYAISTELRRKDTYGPDGEFEYGFTGIGPFCHEFGHTLGLVDMYDTDISESGGGGVAAGHFAVTSLMDAGAYNNGSKTPPCFNAVDRDMLGIGKCEMMKAGSYTLGPISEEGRYLRIDSDNPDEYYLIECRGTGGWDRYVGGSGLGIYHIDKTDNPAGFSDSQNRIVTARERWFSLNEVNCLPDRQCGGMVPAQAGAYPYDAEGYLIPTIASMVFWPYLSFDAFTPHTNPAFTFYGDGSSPVPSPLILTDIARNGSSVSFNVKHYSEDEIPSPANLKFHTFQDAIIVTWEANDSNYYGTGWLEWSVQGGETTTEEVSQYEKGKYSLTIGNLSPKTACHIEVYFKFGETEGTRTTGNPSTNTLSGGFPYIYLNNVRRNSDGSFPKGTGLPLRLFNATSAEDISWFYGTRAVTTDLSGFFHPTSSGTLKAVITWKNGTTETILKQITISD